jgi:hypothetical protein
MGARVGLKRNDYRITAFCGMLLLSTLMLAPKFVAAQGKPVPSTNQAFLYEMSEDAVLVNTAGHVLVPDPAGKSPTGLIDSVTGAAGFPASRNAVSVLQGVAALFTPLCPASALVTVVNPNSETCTVTATGFDNVQLQVDPASGQVIPIGGPLFGTYQVVVQLDNSIDSPELPLLAGAFYGTITFGQVGTPVGRATGFFVPSGQVSDAQACTAASTACLPFRATFRQPFAIGATGPRTKPKRTHDAFYLLDSGQLQPVRQDERALGWPTVRFEVNFVQ